MVNGELVLKSGGKVAGDLGRALWNTGDTAVELGADILGRGSDILSGVGTQVKPLGDGVNDILQGILGLPLIPKGNQKMERPELPVDGKRTDESPFENKSGLKETQEPGLPLLRDLDQIPGRALDLLGRGLGTDPAQNPEKVETSPKAEEKRSTGQRKTSGSEPTEGRPAKPVKD